MITKEELKSALHTRYFQRYLQLMPGQAMSSDSQRLTIAFFSISGLDILNKLDKLTEDDKDNIIDWVYSLQVPADENGENWHRCGFQGSSTFISSFDNSNALEYDCSHIAMTYTGLAILTILGDDFSRVNKQAVIMGVRALQQEDGSFCATLGGSENDMRFVYCAACVCFMLQDWSGMDKNLTEKYILESLSYEGGFAQGPGLEAHGGTTYCAVATLALMGRLHISLTDDQIYRLRVWCLSRQSSGFQGRPNKQVDTCYSFWIGATIKIMDSYDFIDYAENRKYIMSTQDSVTGGFSKWADTIPDPLHTYFGICGLSLMDEPGLLKINPSLNISERAVEHLVQVHDKCRAKF